MDTIDTVIEEQMNDEIIDGNNIVIEEKELDMWESNSSIGTTEPEDIDQSGGMKEEMPERQSSVLELIGNMERIKEANEHDKANKGMSPRGSASPRSGTVSPREGSISPNEGSVNQTQKAFEMSETIPEEPVVSVTSIVKNNKLVSEKQTFEKEEEQLSHDKRVMETQYVNVKIGCDDEEQPIESSNIDDMITINGQPVPHTTTIVLNGHISKIKDSPRMERDKGRERSESPRLKSCNLNTSRDYMPQTDIDTLETKITNNVEPLDISNPDDDSSDQRSDTGSVNTVDSVEKDELIKESPHTRRKGHIRPRGDRVS